MSSPRIHLDFVRARPAWDWTQRASFAIALGVAVGTAWWFVSLRADVARQENASVGNAASRLQVRQTTDLAQTLASTEETRRRLSLPWERLFSTLEAARSSEIALLEIKPEPELGTVNLEGEAKNYSSLLAYVAELSKQPGLRRVHLSRHEIRQSEAEQPVAFAVSAMWKALP
jgi:hypothetical protein